MIASVFPKNNQIQYVVDIISDTSLERLVNPTSLDVDLATIGDNQFVSIQEGLNEYLNGDPDGEVFIRLSKIENDGVQRELMIVPVRYFTVGKDSWRRTEPLEMICKTSLSVVATVFNRIILPESIAPRRDAYYNQWSFYEASRISLFARDYQEPIPHESCYLAWKECVTKLGDMKKILKLLLDSGYNFLAESQWFYHAYNDVWEEKKNKTENRKRQVYNILLDNKDMDDMEYGEGLCPAIVAWEEIRSGVELFPFHNYKRMAERITKVAELKRLSDIRRIKNLSADFAGLSYSGIGIGVQYTNVMEYGYRKPDTQWEEISAIEVLPGIILADPSLVSRAGAIQSPISPTYQQGWLR